MVRPFSDESANVRDIETHKENNNSVNTKPTTTRSRWQPSSSFSQVLDRSDLNVERHEETKAAVFLDLAAGRDDETSPRVDWNLGMKAVVEAEAAYPVRR